MKGAGATAGAAFALANLYLLSLTGPLVSPQHELVFHLTGSATKFFVPAILDILFVFVLLLSAMLAVRCRPRLQLLLWSGLLLALPSGLISTVYGFNGFNVPVWLGWPVALGALLAFFFLNLRPRLTLPPFRRLLPHITLVFSFFALPELLLVLQLLWYGWEARDLNPPFVPAPTSVAAASAGRPQPRVLWILMDELSYDQVYGHRYPGLQLPNLDWLASQSVNFTDAQAAAQYTRRAMPSLMTGLALRSTQPSADGRTLSLVLRGSGKKIVFRPEDTVFADAQRDGLQTAIVGWYEPYCRLLPRVLDRCFWTYHDELPAGLTDNGTLLEHTVEPLLHFVRLSTRPAGIGPVMPTYGALDVHRHRADYDALLHASDDLLHAGQPGLILIHMPIPHPWGFYDRRNHSFPNHRTSYLDNLALADAYIGRVEEELERKNLWDSTSVLVMGDHSWRTNSIWSSSAHWTAEEQAASHGGRFDPRPAYLLKMPGEHRPAFVTEPFDAVRTRALLDGLMAGRLATPADVQHWAAASGNSPASSLPALTGTTE